MTESARTAAVEKAPGDTAHSARMAVIVLALAAGFAVVPRVTAGCGKTSGDEEGPDFTATVIANAADPSQHTVTLSALRGHPVLIDFWATWCGPCQVELPIVNGVARRFKDEGLVVLGVNTDDKDGRVLAPALAARKGITFPILLDPDNAVGRKYHVDGLPTLVVLSKEGKIVAVRSGVTGEAELERLVRKVL
ncbi:MAG TPA: TlpA disulfide reductase family protein [Labilithrix sp.]|nr:TlpA disulfide reductase family protein [Labilithrix sp.]